MPDRAAKHYVEALRVKWILKLIIGGANILKSKAESNTTISKCTREKFVVLTNNVNSRFVTT